VSITCPFCNSPLESGIQPSTDGSKTLGPANEEALRLLTPKLKDLATRVDDMTDVEFGDWVDALPKPQFIEFLCMDEDVRAKIMFGEPAGASV
jgi:hypothetical protein